MFVLESTYRKKVRELSRQLADAITARNVIADKWNKLVIQINEKGGQEFLDKAKIGNVELSKDDISRLLMLCHPDKHGGKEMAQEMTQKLLELKSKILD